MNPQRAQRKIQFILDHDQVRFRLQLILCYQLPDRQPTQVHESFGLGQQNWLVPNLHSCRQSPALPVPDLNATLTGDAIHRKKAQVMRRELILDAWIAETNDQFHAELISSAHVPSFAWQDSRGLSPHEHYFFSFFSAFFSPFSGFSAPPASPSPSASALPFLITSGSLGVAPASAATASGVATTSSFTEVTCATG